MAAKTQDYSFSLGALTLSGVTYDVYVDITDDHGRLVKPAGEPEKRELTRIVTDVLALHAAEWNKTHGAGTPLPPIARIDDAGAEIGGTVQAHAFKVKGLTTRFAQAKGSADAIWNFFKTEAIHSIAQAKPPGQIRLENYFREILDAPDALAKIRELIDQLREKNKQDADILQQILKNFERSGEPQDSDTFKDLLTENIKAILKK